MRIDLPAVPTSRLTGAERFTNGTATPDTNMTVLAFWQWAASHLTDNVTRGLLAEYLVACALGVADGVRCAWDACDLRTASGLRVEVKSAAYLQSWAQQRLSAIAFGIGPKLAFDANTGQTAAAPDWHSDLYVFCLLRHQDKATLNPLDLTQWEFYVAPTALLRQQFGGRASIGLKDLRILSIAPVAFAALQAAVQAAAPAPVG